MWFSALIPDFILAYFSFRNYLKRKKPETLLISSNKSYWLNKRVDKCVKEITPRINEKYKSSWAVMPVFTDSNQKPDFDEFEKQLLILHAATLYVSREKFRKDKPEGNKRIITPRSMIEGVCLRRDAFAWNNVIEDDGSHIVKQLNSLHRSIVLLKDVEIVEVVSSIIDEAKFTEWRYSRQQIETEIINLIKNDLIRSEYIELCVEIFDLSKEISK